VLFSGGWLPAAVLTAGSALAEFRPGYEQPIYQAELVVMTHTFRSRST
jgi:hypothetical protein